MHFFPLPSVTSAHGQVDTHASQPVRGSHRHQVGPCILIPHIPEGQGAVRSDARPLPVRPVHLLGDGAALLPPVPGFPRATIQGVGEDGTVLGAADELPGDVDEVPARAGGPQGEGEQRCLVEVGMGWVAGEE